MNWTVTHGDILDCPAEVLVLSGNPQLNLSGGAGGAFVQRYGIEMQQQLHKYLSSNSIRSVPCGSVVPMPPCGSPYTVVLHAIAIDAFYDSNADVVQRVVMKALQMSANLGARKIALTALATGYGRLSLAEFAEGIRPLIAANFLPVDRVDVCLKKLESAEELVRLLPGVQLGVL